MATASVLPINATAKRVRKQAATEKAQVTVAGKFRRQHVAAGAIALLAGSLTFLSVHHLAYGYQSITGVEQWEALISACGIDFGFLMLELAQIVTVRDTTLRHVQRWANPAIAVTLSGSAALNAYAFMQGASSPVAIGAAVLMGCFLPAFVYVLTRVSAHLAHH